VSERKKAKRKQRSGDEAESSSIETSSIRVSQSVLGYLTQAEEADKVRYFVPLDDVPSSLKGLSTVSVCAGPDTSLSLSLDSLPVAGLLRFMKLSEIVSEPSELLESWSSWTPKLQLTLRAFIISLGSLEFEPGMEPWSS
jgi:hypothetical protein